MEKDIAAREERGQGMNQEDIIRMAREAGMVQDYDCFFSPSDQDMDVHITDLERFAALVESNLKTRIADAIQEMPFGDTSNSFAAYVRDFK